MYKRQEQKKSEALMREATARGLVEDAKGDKMRNLIHPQLLQTQHLGLAVEQQWGEMDRNGLMGRWIRQGKDQERVRGASRSIICSCASYLNSTALRWAWLINTWWNSWSSRRLRAMRASTAVLEAQ